MMAGTIKSSGIILIGLMLLSLNCSESNLTQDDEFSGKTVMIKSTDGLELKGDLYEVGDSKKPIILLFHQAGYSRGEYRPIAPKLNDLGYTCLAIDQRSGDKINGVINETKIQADKNGLDTEYADAYPDLEAALNYAKTNYPDQEIIIWGSSYSSSLNFILASKHPDNVAAILSFSPGNYFEFEHKKIEAFASKVTCPVFITSAKNEGNSWASIFDEIPSENKQSFLPEGDGQHGSKALWESNDGFEEYWVAVEEFLGSVGE